MKKQTIKIIFSWILVILWMSIIFYLSSMNTVESNTKSKDTINTVIDTTITTTNNIGLTDKNIPEEKEQQLIDILNKPLRKCAHASVYFILSILLLNALLTSHYKFKKKYSLTIILTILLCFLYAITDEYHQTFIPGRTGQLSDILIDTIGSTLSLILISIIYHKKSNHNPNKTLHPM